MSAAAYPNDHLLNLYLKWKDDPKRYANEMGVVIDKIVYTVVKRNKKKCIIHSEETYLDWLNDLKIEAYRALYRIKPPYTNKRIYNFLRVSVSFAILTKARELGKYMDKKPEADISVCTGIQQEAESPLINFTSPLANDIAKLLIEGHPQYKICEMLNITRTTLKSNLEQIKEELTW